MTIFTRKKIEETYEKPLKDLAKATEKVANGDFSVYVPTINSADEYDYLDYKCPKRGEITELIVSKNTRSKGIGNELIKKLEEYFKSQNCEYVLVDVFAYNEIGINFYNKQGYHPRMLVDIKKL